MCEIPKLYSSKELEYFSDPIIEEFLTLKKSFMKIHPCPWNDNEPMCTQTAFLATVSCFPISLLFFVRSWAGPSGQNSRQSAYVWASEGESERRKCGLYLKRVTEDMFRSLQKKQEDTRDEHKDRKCSEASHAWFPWYSTEKGPRSCFQKVSQQLDTIVRESSLLKPERRLGPVIRDQTQSRSLSLGSSWPLDEERP